MDPTDLFPHDQIHAYRKAQHGQHGIQEAYGLNIDLKGNHIYFYLKHHETMQ